MEGRRLARLPLWTSKSWVSDRPVYATDDPVLAAGLRDRLPFWEPGAELEQFRPLLGPLRVTEIRTGDADVIEPALAYKDNAATALFRAALRLLREDLACNDPQLAASMAVPWDSLDGFDVSVHPSLTLRVHTVSDRTDEGNISEVAARVDASLGTVFVRDAAELRRVDVGGRALATLFKGDARRLAQAWRAACEQAEDGLEARRVELAPQREERERAQMESDIERRMTEFRGPIPSKRPMSRASTGRAVDTGLSPGAVGNERDHSETAAKLGAPRTLVDPQSVRLLESAGAH